MPTNLPNPERGADSQSDYTAKLRGYVDQGVPRKEAEQLARAESFLAAPTTAYDLKNPSYLAQRAIHELTRNSVAQTLGPLAETPAELIPPAIFRKATDAEKDLMRANIRRYLAQQSVEEELKKAMGVAKIQPDYLALIKESLNDLAVYYTGFCAPLEDFLRLVKRKDVHGEAVRILTAFYEKIFPSAHPPFATEH